MIIIILCIHFSIYMKIIYSLLIVVHDGIGPSAPLEEDGGLPDWAIAVVVIGLGSFAFVLVFGITVVSTIQLMMYEFFMLCSRYITMFCSY